MSTRTVMNGRKHPVAGKAYNFARSLSMDDGLWMMAGPRPGRMSRATNRRVFKKSPGSEVRGYQLD